MQIYKCTALCYHLNGNVYANRTATANRVYAQYAHYTVAVCGILQSQCIDEWMKNACDFTLCPKSIPLLSLLAVVWFVSVCDCPFFVSLYCWSFWFQINGGTLLPHVYSTKSRLLDCNGPDQSSCIEPDQEQWRIAATKLLFNGESNKSLARKLLLPSNDFPLLASNTHQSVRKLKSDRFCLFVCFQSEFELSWIWTIMKN